MMLGCWSRAGRGLPALDNYLPIGRPNPVDNSESLTTKQRFDRVMRDLRILRVPVHNSGINAGLVKASSTRGLRTFMTFEKFIASGCGQGLLFLDRSDWDLDNADEGTYQLKDPGSQIK